MLITTLFVGLAQEAAAANYTVKFCVSVDVDFDDDLAGDYWTTPTADRPARGFLVQVYDNIGATHVFDDYAEDSGSDAGCTPNLVLSDTQLYSVTVKSEARVEGITIKALDSPAGNARASALVYGPFVPSASGTINTSVLPGSTEARWNHTAIAAWAMSQHKLGLTAQTLKIFEDACCFAEYSGAGAGVHLLNATHRYLATHEIGHWATELRDAGGTGTNNDTGASDDGCDGDASTSNVGPLTKEYHSSAAVEGVADFYSALVWNANGASADCDYVHHYDLDWDLDGDWDQSVGEVHPCIGDPWAGNPNPDDEDWLEDMVTLDDTVAGGDLVECQGTLTNRGTRFDWTRYLWAMRTIEGVSLTTIWDVWDGADPFDWNAADSGPAADMPLQRWTDAVTAEGVLTEHQNQDEHGLDH